MSAHPKEKISAQGLRDLINEALQDSRKEKIQLEILNTIFENTVKGLGDLVDQRVKLAFERISEIKQGDRNRGIIWAFTRGGGYAPELPAVPMIIPVDADFAQFSAEDVMALPGYIKLHEVAREKNVALSLSGLIAGAGQGDAPALVVDIGMGYEEGASEPDAYYPELPQKPVVFDRAMSARYGR